MVIITQSWQQLLMCYQKQCTSQYITYTSCSIYTSEYVNTVISSVTLVYFWHNDSQYCMVLHFYVLVFRRYKYGDAFSTQRKRQVNSYDGFIINEFVSNFLNIHSLRLQHNDNVNASGITPSEHLPSAINYDFLQATCSQECKKSIFITNFCKICILIL